MNSKRRTAKTQNCWACTVNVSTSGFAANAHQHSAGHIAAMIASGNIEEANRLQAEATINAKNRRTQAENTRIWKASRA